MSNHVHWIVIPGQPDSLARAFGQAHGRYAHYANALRNRSGHFWQNRFFSCALLYVQDVQKRIGDTIRALRLKRGWSQDVFADKSGLNRAHVGEVERGESNVTIQTLKTIAETLGVKITDLVKGL